MAEHGQPKIVSLLSIVVPVNRHRCLDLNSYNVADVTNLWLQTILPSSLFVNMRLSRLYLSKHNILLVLWYRKCDTVWGERRRTGAGRDVLVWVIVVVVVIHSYELTDKKTSCSFVWNKWCTTFLYLVWCNVCAVPVEMRTPCRTPSYQMLVSLVSNIQSRALSLLLLMLNVMSYWTQNTTVVKYKHLFFFSSHYRALNTMLLPFTSILKPTCPPTIAVCNV